MPFVTPEHRKHPDVTIPGDRCYLEYKLMMDQWKKSRSWTTVDQLLQGIFPDPFKRAYVLAFAVFFYRHVLNYEREKMLENGDI
jgi:hypothetical protein